MLLQTNSYVVPKDRRAEHSRLLRKFRQTLARLGCDQFEVYEQMGANWGGQESTGRFVQIMRFRDRRHQQSVQEAERSDPAAQSLIAEFCELINFPYQQQQGLFAVGFYSSALPVTSVREPHTEEPVKEEPEHQPQLQEVAPPAEGSRAEAPPAEGPPAEAPSEDIQEEVEAEDVPQEEGEVMLQTMAEGQADPQEQLEPHEQTDPHEETPRPVPRASADDDEVADAEDSAEADQPDAAEEREPEPLRRYPS